MDAGMSRTATVLFLAALAAVPSDLRAQAFSWRQIGNTSLVAGQASVAGGPVERVWFDPSGRLLALLPGGRVFAIGGQAGWTEASELQPPPPAGNAAAAPEAGARVLSAGSVRYAGGRHVWRSEDGGSSWKNLTAWAGGSLLGGTVRDLAADPRDPERIAAATDSGVWVSLDGGRSWTGFNEGLPSLAVRRILAAPAGSRGVRIAVDRGGRLEEFEWYPGQRLGWFPAPEGLIEREEAQRAGWSAELGATITAVAATGGTLYLGGSDGRLYASADGGSTWRTFESSGAGAVLRVWTDGSDRNFALAALAAGAEEAPRLLRTLNGGAWWDDLSPGLPPGDVFSVAADRETGAIYAATSAGLYWTLGDLRNPAPPTPWQSAGAGLPRGAVRDVRLDDNGLTLLAAVEGYGVFAAPAPHRRRAPRLVHSADLSSRPAAPGALMTLVGARASSAVAGGRAAPVLDAGEEQSQIQLPFELTGASVEVALQAGGQRMAFGLALAPASPAVLIDHEGTPMVLDADTGAPVELMNPARPGMTLQILMSGLGRVEPAWPAGMPAPLENPPAVTVPVRAWLGTVPLEVRRATLAPGYVGFYLVEAELPALLDEGIHELTVEAGGIRSNPVRIYAVP